MLKIALEEWDTKAKDPAIVTDNAPNMTIAAQLAKVLHLKFSRNPSICLYSMLKFLTVVCLLGGVRPAFQTQCNRRPCTMTKTKATTAARTQTTDVVARWNRAYDMLQRFLDQLSAICAALLSGEVRKTEKEIYTLIF